MCASLAGQGKIVSHNLIHVERYPNVSMVHPATRIVVDVLTIGLVSIAQCQVCYSEVLPMFKQGFGCCSCSNMQSFFADQCSPNPCLKPTYMICRNGQSAHYCEGNTLTCLMHHFPCC